MSKFSTPDKLKLCSGCPTPIQKLPKLSKIASKFSEVELFAKRDDLTHGPAAGNKVRKLEFLLGEALAKKMKVVFTCGGLQSNHARATAILCREVGLECVLFLRGDAPSAETPLEGNLLLDQLAGAKIEYVSREEYDGIARVFVAHAEPYRKRDGKMPLLVPEGGSNDIGTMGYISAFEEIAAQAGNAGLPSRFSSIVSATGSGGTQAGLLLGRNLFGWDDDCQVVGFNISRTAGELADRVKHAMIVCVQRYRLPTSFMPADIHVIDGYVGPGYAKATPELYDFIVEVAREDGLLLDPVYTGKALFGLMSELTASPERAKLFGNRVLFIHTGGFPSLFAHAEEFSRALGRARR
jgi:D-cysteine desulfhydrase